MGKRIQRFLRTLFAWMLTAPLLIAVVRFWREFKRRIRGQELRLRYYHQPDDPYSYLMLQLLPKILANYMVRLEVKIVQAPGLEAIPEPELWREYAKRDAAILAAHYGLDFPENAQAPSQRMIARAETILVKHQESENIFALALQLSKALWRNQEAELDQLRHRFGGVEGFVAERVCALNAMERYKRGHYLGGAVSFAGEWFWGVDRLPFLEQRLAKLKATRPEAVVPVVKPVVTQQLPAPVLKLLPAPDQKLPPLEFFYSFRSPYSYIVLKRVFDLVERTGVELRVRPIAPMVVRGIKLPLPKKLYILMDVAREARKAGVPFGRVADPLAAWERAFSIFPLAEQHNAVKAYLLALGEGVWSKGIDISEDGGLRKVVETAGLDWGQAQEAMKHQHWRGLAEENQRVLRHIGLWGVPSFRFGQFICWGQDRFWLLDQVISTATSRAKL